jgi:hypothetical protein
MKEARAERERQKKGGKFIYMNKKFASLLDDHPLRKHHH